MTTKEQVWRTILSDYRLNRRVLWQQKELAGRLGMAVSTVNAGLAVPRRAGAIRVGGRGFELADWRKLLLIWAVFRNIEKETVWTARLALSAGDGEGEMIPEARFTGPSAFKFFYGFTPADYDQVVVYVADEDLPALQNRFRPYLRRHAGKTTLTALRPDPLLPDPVPPEQVYVDLWQMHPWWTAEFIRALEDKLHV